MKINLKCEDNFLKIILHLIDGKFIETTKQECGVWLLTVDVKYGHRMHWRVDVTEVKLIGWQLKQDWDTL